MAVDYNKPEEIKDVSPKKEGPDKREKKKQIAEAKPPKKKNLVERLVYGVLGPDGLPGITSYVGHEIILPAVKNIVADALTSGINMAMFGGERSPKPNSHYVGPATGAPINRHPTQYSRYAPTPQSRYAPQDSVATTPAPIRRDRSDEVVQYVITDRTQAIEVLDSLTEQLLQYGSVSVADYYDMIGVESKFTDNNYGWNSDELARASIAPTRGGYILKLPPVTLI